MSNDTVGYLDRSKIKGQYYRYAGSPIPTVFTGDFDTISEDLLAKAMFVTNDGSSVSTFPTTDYDSYLLTTTKFGNGAYLQNAFSVGLKIDYARIYVNGAWSDWVTSNAGDVSEQITTLNGKINAIYDSDTNKGKLVDLANNLELLDSNPQALNGTGKVPSLITSVNNINSSISSINTKIGNKIQQVTLSRNITMSNSHETNGYFQLTSELNYPANSILIGMRVNTSSVGAINGTIYMLTHASNGTKPYIGYQKASGVTFSNVQHDFIFTFYVP